MPESRQASTLPTVEADPEDLSVMILPDQEADETVPEPAPMPSSVPASPRSPTKEADLLPTNVIPESPPRAPQPMPAATPPEITEPTATDELPIADDPSPTFTPPPTEPEDPVDEGPLMGYGDRFPHYAGAVGGCFGLSECRQVSGVGSYRTVARSLIAGLEEQGYLVELRDDLEDTGRNVYELTPPGPGTTRQFLMVFSNTDGSAIYVMSPDVMTLDELKALAAQSGDDRPPV